MKVGNSVKILVDEKGFSKYNIAKLVGVSWNSVHMWYLGIFEPQERSKAKLEGILKETQNES